MTYVWVRDNPSSKWHVAFTDKPKEKAHKIADRYNEKYDKQYYVKESKPDSEVTL